MKTKLVAAKEFATRHKIALAVTGTAVICTYLHIKTVEGWNEFLAENNLLDTYYALED